MKIESWETVVRTMRYAILDDEGAVTGEEAYGVLLRSSRDEGRNCEGCGVSLDGLSVYVRSEIGGEMWVEECASCFLASEYVGKIEVMQQA